MLKPIILHCIVYYRGISGQAIEVVDGLCISEMVVDHVTVDVSKS